MVTKAEFRAFWARQFAPKVTRRQVIFDVLFGIALPIVCLVLDPFVFRGRDPYKGGDFYGLFPMLDRYAVFFYTAIVLGMIMLPIWLAARARLERWANFIAGILLCGPLVAGFLGLMLSPATIVAVVASLAGLILSLSASVGLTPLDGVLSSLAAIVIGFVCFVLGITPFLAAVVYLRNGSRALRSAEKHLPPNRALAGPVLLGLLLIIGVPALAQWQANQIVARNIHAILYEDRRAGDAAVQTLKRMPWCSGHPYCFEALIEGYDRETDANRRAYIDYAYADLAHQVLPQVWQIR